VNPVQKDTFVVPNKGYIILRFYTDNLGNNIVKFIAGGGRGGSARVSILSIIHSKFDLTAYQDIGCGKREVLLYILHYSGLGCNS